MPAKKKTTALRFLILESNESHAHLLQQALKKSFKASTVDLVNETEKALKKIHSKEYQCIFTDFSIGGVGGKILIPSLRAQAPRTPLIVITGKGNEKTAAQAIKLGADDYIAKNKESLAILTKVVHKAIAKKNSSLIAVLDIPQTVVQHLKSELDHLSEIAQDIKDKGNKNILDQIQKVKALTQSLLKNLP
jgi:DNA-binding NtrC family response regulator